MSSPRHPFELLLEQLTGRMSTPGRPIRHSWGTQADAAHASADRIAWIPSGIDPRDALYDTENAETVGTQEAPHEVSIYGGSPAAVYQLHSELWGWLDLIIGPKNGCPAVGSNPARPGYSIGPAKVEPRGGDAGSTGWGAVVLVTLKTQVIRRYFPLGTVRETSVEVVTTDLDGTGEQLAISTDDA